MTLLIVFHKIFYIEKLNILSPNIHISTLIKYISRMQQNKSINGANQMHHASRCYKEHAQDLHLQQEHGWGRPTREICPHQCYMGCCLLALRQDH